MEEKPMVVKKSALAVVVGVVALGAGVGIAGVASADPTPTPTPTASASGTPSPGPDRGGPGGRPGGGLRDGGRVPELARLLGVSEDKVRAALEGVRDERRANPRSTDQTREERDAALAGALAAKLGVEETEVAAALAELRTARQAERAAALESKLDAAVADGTLTRAEADAVTKAVEKGVIRGFGRGPR
jgi:DNA-binding transcriptional regulator YdaS (Cro superfamily)